MDIGSMSFNQLFMFANKKNSHMALMSVIIAAGRDKITLKSELVDPHDHIYLDRIHGRQQLGRLPRSVELFPFRL